MVIINSLVFAKTPLLILFKDLKKACICIGEFDILKAKSNTIFPSNINDTISKVFYHDPNFKSIFDTDIFSNKMKKDSKNAKLKIVKKKYICKSFI